MSQQGGSFLGGTGEVVGGGGEARGEEVERDGLNGIGEDLRYDIWYTKSRNLQASRCTPQELRGEGEVGKAGRGGREEVAR